MRRGDERSRSFTSSKLEDNQLSGKTARRAHSFGVLNTSRNRSPNNENKIPFSTGSITKRTPVKVNQSNVLKDHARHYSQEPVKYNRTEQSFQYDSKPIIQCKTPSSHSTVNARSKNKKESDYISVKALIKQWSGPDGKKNIHSQPNHEQKYRNRRSLPANFDASDILSETTKIPQSKSAAEAVHYRGQRSYMSKSDWTLHARVPSDEKRDCPDRKQAYPGENRLRRKSEPSTYSGKEYDPSLIERNRSSSMKNKDDFNHRDVNNRSRESLIKKREFTQDSYAAIPYPQLKSLKDVRSKDHYSEHGCTSRKSFPLTQKVKVKHVENYMNQKFYHPKDTASVDRQKLESIGKYSTVPEKRTKGNHNENISKNYEKAKTTINGDKIGRKTDNKSNKVIERPPRRFSSERNSKSDRRLPTYEEAIIPLEETDAVDATILHQINDKKMIEKEYVSIEIVQQKRSRDKGKSFNVTRKESDYSPQKQLVNENVSKQYATQVYASEVNHPISPSKDATRNYEMLYKRRHSQEKSQDFPFTKPTATPKYKAIGASEFDARKSSNTMHHNNVHEKDMNNNQLPVYDEEALKTLLTSHKKGHEKDNKREENSFFSNYSKLKEENQGGLNEYERLREEQKVILDEDFKDRSKTHMNPNVARQFTSQDGVSFSNVVHERELLQLVAAEEKYWKEKVERKDKTETKEAPLRQKEIKRFEDDKQERVNEMLREFKMHDQREKIDYSEITDTLRAEEEFLAQEAEKLLKQRFQEKSKMQPTKDLQGDVKKHHDDSPKVTSPVEGSSSGLHSILKTPRSRQKKSSSVTSSDDINLKPEADQAYHYNRPKRIPRSRSPIYVCSGCRLPVERDICLYVAELQSYWHEKCFRCSVCHSNLIQNEQTPKIRVMFSRIHCENCLSNKRTGKCVIIINEIYQRTNFRYALLIYTIHLKRNAFFTLALHAFFVLFYSQNFM